MTWKKLWFAGSLALILAGFLIAAGGAGANSNLSAVVNNYAVGIDSYTIGSVTVNPTTAYVNDQVTITGVGQLPNEHLEVGIIGRSQTDYYDSQMGATVTDAAGSWSVTASVPSQVTRESDKASVPMLYGTWTVLGVSQGPDGGLYGSTGSLTVNQAAPPVETAPASQTMYSATLPSTGIPPLAAWLSGLGLLTAAALGVQTWCARRNLKRPSDSST